MLNRLSEGKSVPESLHKKFKVKRAGKDKDDMFWAFGKIHGLENLALCDPDEIAEAAGDPMALRRLVNKANDAPKPLPPGSFDENVSALRTALDHYKE